MLSGDASGATPLTNEDAVALFQPWFRGRAAPVLLAVSGGPDSTALMQLAAAAARSIVDSATLHVATIDHSLRPESRGEAEKVRDAAAMLGLPAAVLTWVGSKPTTRLQEAAREARYQLLCDHARTVGANVILTAHTLDDQAETVLMRLLHGSGLGGLAAMRSEHLIGDIRLVRPFLQVTKSRLVATCRAHNWSYMTDPSNANERFARVRMRKLMTALAGEGLSAARLARLAKRMRRAEEALDEAARRALDATLRLDSDRGALDLEGYRNQPAEIRVRLVALTLAAMARHLASPPSPRLERTETLSARLDQAIAGQKPLRATCGGCRIILSKGKITFVPEDARQRGGNRDKSYHRAQLGFSPPAP